ncbi:MAG: hypothetical protein ACI9T9_000972 [Oleiphilaceae bacterium]|jgi:hypothetical protein
MRKLSETERAQALITAGEMREQDNDPDFIAKSLLSLNYRFDVWQKVVVATKCYLHSGQNATEHSRLIQTLREAERLDDINHDVSQLGCAIVVRK